jgi:hypothetical protein
VIEFELTFTDGGIVTVTSGFCISHMLSRWQHIQVEWLQSVSASVVY